MYKAIIFDFFGVLSSEVAPIWFRQYFKEQPAFEFDEKYMIKADLGVLTEDQLMSDLSEIVKRPASKIRKEWRDLANVDPIMISLVDKLRGKYKVGLCTNAMASFIRPVLQENNLEALFDAIIISSEARMIKPSREIYQLALDKLSVRPEEAIFIDDNERNLRAARDLGMKCLLFRTREGLLKDFETLLK